MNTGLMLLWYTFITVVGAMTVLLPHRAFRWLIIFFSSVSMFAMWVVHFMSCWNVTLRNLAVFSIFRCCVEVLILYCLLTRRGHAGLYFWLASSQRNCQVHAHLQFCPVKAGAVLFQNHSAGIGKLPVLYELACAEVGRLTIFKVCPYIFLTKVPISVCAGVDI